MDNENAVQNFFDVNVVSYNILTQAYSGPDRLPTVLPKLLDFEFRFSLIIKQLEPEIQKKSIICLQEVSLRFLSKLAAYFQKHDYFVVSSNYDGHYSNFMGVLIAFPSNEYSLESSTVSRLSDTKQWRRREQPKLTLWQKIVQIVNEVLIALRLKVKKFEKDYTDFWNVAKLRYNNFIFLRLTEKKNDENTVCISNYHMPCLYMCPKAMTIHASLLVQQVHRLSKDSPYIIVGDFNTTPTTSLYKLITTGNMDENDNEYPSPIPEDEKWRPKIPKPLQSAYSKILGKEPDLTHYSHPSDHSPESFIGTLDYIFCTPSCSVKSIIELPNLTSAIPSEEYPSDHLLIGACIAVPSSPKY